MANEKLDEFDGIEEEDNPMPDWWLWTFLLTIVFAGIYFIHYHIGTDNSLAKEYAEEKVQVETAIKQNGPKLDDMEAKFLAAVTDQVSLTKAQGVFNERCVACHGPKGEGLIGPNLTDNAWIHGNKVLEIAKVVNEGVLTKGMPAWGQVLNSDQLIGIVGYVKSLEGKNIPGKAAEGEVRN